MYDFKSVFFKLVRKKEKKEKKEKKNILKTLLLPQVAFSQNPGSTILLTTGASTLWLRLLSDGAGLADLGSVLVA